MGERGGIVGVLRQLTLNMHCKRKEKLNSGIKIKLKQIVGLY